MPVRKARPTPHPLLLTLFLLSLLLTILPSPTTAGTIERLPDRTILHVTVHDWMWYELDPVRTDAATRANVEAVRAFTKEFPKIFAERYAAKWKKLEPETNWDNVEVRIGKFSGIKVEGVESDLLAIAGNVAPDILYLNFRKSDTFIQQGFLYPLDKPEDGYWSALPADEIDRRINPKILPVVKRPGPGGEHVWAMPHGGVIGKVLIYRKDRFDEAGLAYPDATWTWTDLHNASRKLTDPANGRYAIALRNVKHESWRWLDFLMATGAEVLHHDAATDTWSVAFNNENTVDALDYYVTLCTEPWTDATGKARRGYAYRDPGYAASAQAWKTGDIAMLLGTIQEDVFSKTFDPTIVGLAPMPIASNGNRASALNSKMMALYAQIPHGALRDAAWEFIRHYESEAAMAIKTRVLVEGGLGRFINPERLQRHGFGELVRFAPKGWAETFRISVDHSQPEPYGRFANPVYDILDVPIKTANELALDDQLGTGDARRTKLRELVDAAATRARREMLGVTPPDELRKRRLTAAVFVTVLTLVFAFAFRWIFGIFRPPPVPGDDAPRSFLGEIRQRPVAYFILLPALLTIFVWQYVPLVQGSIMAFQDYRIMGDSRWVWLDNFGEVLWNADWWASVWAALRYSFLVIVLTFLPPVGLAILLQEVPRGKVLFRTIYYMPHVFTGLVVILLWKSFYGPDETGMLNRLVLAVPAWGFALLGLALLALLAAVGHRLAYHATHRAAFAFFIGGALLAISCWGFVFRIAGFEPTSIHSLLLILGLTATTAGFSMALRKQWLPVVAALLLPFGLLVAGFVLLGISPAATLDEPTRWLTDPATAMIACVIPLVWAGIGPGCLLYLAALKGVPDELYEAADLDGATFIDKILFIIFPMLKPLLIINFVGVFISSWFYSTANILAMTGGQAGTEVAGLHIFYKAFMYLKFGPATAMAWILGLMLILFTMYQLRILSRLEFRTADNIDT